MDKPGPSGQNNQKPSKQASATQIVCEEETEEETVSVSTHFLNSLLSVL